MVHPEAFQQSQPNQQGWGSNNPQYGQSGWGLTGNSGSNGSGFGLGQGAYGQTFGPMGGQPFWQANIPSSVFGNSWGSQQRQLSQQDVGDVIRQLLPLLPQLIAQAQPQAAYGQNGFGQGGFGQGGFSQGGFGQNAFGQGGFGQGGFGYGQTGNNQWGPQNNPFGQQGNAFGQQGTIFGQQGRGLSPQDVNEVVRQILPLMPHIANALQGQNPYAYSGQYGQGGIGQGFGGQGMAGQGFGGPQNPLAQILAGQQGYGQQQSPFMAAFGGAQQQQRQLSQQDVSEVARQLVAIIPQVIGALQANQQRAM
jgi:hypothetical protein